MAQLGPAWPSLPQLGPAWSSSPIAHWTHVACNGSSIQSDGNPLAVQGFLSGSLGVGVNISMKLPEIPSSFLESPMRICGIPIGFQIAPIHNYGSFKHSHWTLMNIVWGPIGFDRFAIALCRDCRGFLQQVQGFTTRFRYDFDVIPCLSLSLHVSAHVFPCLSMFFHVCPCLCPCLSMFPSLLNPYCLS